MARGLDPFGDGSLIESFSCETLLNDQSTRSTTIGTPTVLDYPHVVNKGLLFPDSMDGVFVPSLNIDTSSTDNYSIGFTAIHADQIGNDAWIQFVLEEVVDNTYFEIDEGYLYWELNGQSGWVVSTLESVKVLFVNDTTSNTFSLYVNDVLMDSTTCITIDIFHIYTSFNSAIFGTDEVLFFNKALNETERTTFYNNFPTYVKPDSLLLQTKVLNYSDIYRPDSLLLQTEVLNYSDIFLPDSLLLQVAPLEPLSLSTIVVGSLLLQVNPIEPTIPTIAVGSLLLTIEQLNKYEASYPNSLLLSTLINNPNISTIPIVIGFFPLIPITVNEPIINNLPNTVINAEVFTIDLTLIEPYYFGEAGLGLPLYINPDVIDIEVFVPLPNFAGQPPTISFEPQVKAQSLFIPIAVLYLKSPTNAYIDVDVLDINIVCNEPSMFENVFATTLTIPITISSSIAQPYKDKRVSQIGSVVFKKALYWTQNTKVDPFISSSDLALDGSNIVSIMQPKKFYQTYELTTKDTMSLSKTTVDILISEINEDSYDIIFNDGSFETVKNDLLSKPIIIEPIFEGSDEYYITMGVLV